MRSASATKVLHSLKCGKLAGFLVLGHEWDFVPADRITQLPETDKAYTVVLVVMDKLTKMMHFSSCKFGDYAAVTHVNWSI